MIYDVNINLIYLRLRPWNSLTALPPAQPNSKDIIILKDIIVLLRKHSHAPVGEYSGIKLKGSIH